MDDARGVHRLRVEDVAPVEDGLDAAKSRFTGILADLALDSPKEIAQ